MLFNPTNEGRLDGLTEQLQLAPTPTSELISDVIVGAFSVSGYAVCCERFA
jgi:hypothetical protein